MTSSEKVKSSLPMSMSRSKPPKAGVFVNIVEVFLKTNGVEVAATGFPAMSETKPLLERKATVPSK